MDVILGSQSPRREEILSFFSLPFRVIPPPFDEEAVAYGGDPLEHVRLLAVGKGDALRHLHPEAAIVTADTLVYREGAIFGKPRDFAEALSMLRTLCGGWHTVGTAVTLSQGTWQKTLVSETRVLLQSLTERQMHTYIRSNNALDKAGGYAIQGKGSILIEKIEGCFYNVMGLPLQPLASLFRHIRVDLWDYLD